jgi:hypothetical protein
MIIILAVRLSLLQVEVVSQIKPTQREMTQIINKLVN